MYRKDRDVLEDLSGAVHTYPSQQTHITVVKAKEKGVAAILWDRTDSHFNVTDVIPRSICGTDAILIRMQKEKEKARVHLTHPVVREVVISVYSLKGLYTDLYRKRGTKMHRSSQPFPMSSFLIRSVTAWPLVLLIR